MTLALHRSCIEEKECLTICLCQTSAHSLKCICVPQAFCGSYQPANLEPPILAMSKLSRTPPTRSEYLDHLDEFTRVARSRRQRSTSQASVQKPQSLEASTNALTGPWRMHRGFTRNLCKSDEAESALANRSPPAC